MLARNSVLEVSAPGADAGRETLDQELLQRLGHGDEEAAGQLYHRYARRLLAFANARCTGRLRQCVDAEDIVQSAFRSFFRKAAQGMYNVPDNQELWKLLMVVALNKIRDAVDFHQAAKRDVRMARGGDQVLRLLTQQSEHGKAADAVYRLVLQETVDALPPRSRQIVQLRIEGYEVAEIARCTSRALRSVERVLQEYRSTLRRLLEDE